MTSYAFASSPYSLRVWFSVVLVAGTAVAGDILTAGAMRSLGDLDEIRAKSGLIGAIKAVTSSGMFICGVTAMALSFFSLLYALSAADVSFIAPATASLTYIGNAIVARQFLKENVDRRRWMAVVFVSIGVFLLAK
jgi:multidrug transporter EmrE-like cation transporter